MSLLGRCSLLSLLFGKEDSLDVIKRVEIDVPLRWWKADARRYLKLMHSLELKHPGLRIVKVIFVSLFCSHYQMLRDRPHNLNDSSQLIVFRVAWKQRDTKKELSADTAKGPHVNGSIIGQAKDDLRASIVTWLNVLEYRIALKAGTAEVDNLQVRSINPIKFKKNVLSYDFSSMFSGLRSQCISFASFTTFTASNIWMIIRREVFRDTPWKLFFLSMS